MHHNKPPQRTEQEPVAWALDYDIESVLSGFSTSLMGTAMRIESAFPKHRVKLLYTHPPQRTEQEPCARHCEATAFEIVIKNLRGEIERLKAPKGKPLTDKQIKEIWLNGKDHGDDWLDVQGIARAIEAAHDIKE
jgi:hypothetical protein